MPDGSQTRQAWQTLSPESKHVRNEDSNIVQRYWEAQQACQGWHYIGLFDGSIIAVSFRNGEWAFQAVRNGLEFRRYEDKGRGSLSRRRTAMVSSIVHSMVSAKDEEGRLQMVLRLDSLVYPLNYIIHFSLLGHHVGTTPEVSGWWVVGRSWTSTFPGQPCGLCGQDRGSAGSWYSNRAVVALQVDVSSHCYPLP